MEWVEADLIEEIKGASVSTDGRHIALKVRMDGQERFLAIPTPHPIGPTMAAGRLPADRASARKQPRFTQNATHSATRGSDARSQSGGCYYNSLY